MQDLEAIESPGPGPDTARSVAKLLGFYAHGNATEAGAVAKADVFLEVLEDLPAWAVEEARKRWHRGEIRADTRGFPPEPAEIRRAAQEVVKAAHGQWVVLRRILNAQPRISAPVPKERLDELVTSLEHMLVRRRSRDEAERRNAVALDLDERRRRREAREAGCGND